MNRNQIRRIDKYERETLFISENPQDFPADSPAEKTAQAQNADIQLIKTLASEQASGESSQHISLKDDYLEEIWMLIRMINRAANSMDDEIPAIENLFRLPRNRSDRNILAAAQAYYRDSEPYETAFVEYSVPQGFRDRLRTLIESAESAAASADTAQSNKSGATGEMKEAFAHCAARSVKLNGMVKNKYFNNPNKLTAWMTASHLERAPQHTEDVPPQS